MVAKEIWEASKKLVAIGVAETIPPIYADAMSSNAKARRRWIGALCLLTAIGMLVAGETVFRDQMSPLGFLLYWIGCFVVTGLAALTALRDAACVRAENRLEQRALFEETVRKIESEKRTRSQNQPQTTPAHTNFTPRHPPTGN